MRAPAAGGGLLSGPASTTRGSHTTPWPPILRLLQLTAKEDALGGFTDLLDNHAGLQQLGVAHGDMVRLDALDCQCTPPCAAVATLLSVSGRRRAADVLWDQPLIERSLCPAVRCAHPATPPPLRGQVFLLYHFEREVAPAVRKADWERRPFGAHMDVATMVAAQTRIERQDAPHAASASFDFAAANAFQSYVSSAIAFSIKRGGIMYGTGERRSAGEARAWACATLAVHWQRVRDTRKRASQSAAQQTAR